MYTITQIKAMLVAIMDYAIANNLDGSIKFYRTEMYVHMYFGEKRYQAFIDIKDIYDTDDEEVKELINIYYLTQTQEVENVIRTN